ncbi:MAG: hypothetical protein HOQ35_00595 [Acidobacteriaceae bacterium]|nr:hypothetical protein [Acidobacteriaceae bacterium]
MLRALKIAGIAVLLLLAITITAVHIQEYRLEQNTAELLADIRGIDLGKSDWNRAQKFIERWKPWGRASENCSTADCYFSVTLSQSTPPYQASLTRKLAFLTRAVLQHAFGKDDAADIRASITVIDGKIWGRGLILGITKYHAADKQRYPIIAEARTVDSPQSNLIVETYHPEFSIGGPAGCTICIAGWLSYTPFADSATISRLMDFRLDCLHRQVACDDREDIMPAATAFDAQFAGNKKEVQPKAKSITDSYLRRKLTDRVMADQRKLEF